MHDFERLGAFYLGRMYDPAAKQPQGDLLLYDSKDLTTHAVCVGMTGSGKTGLCLALLEEAAIDGIPAIVIDPKGDIGNLLLTFPELRPEDFQPWVDPSEAARQGRTLEEHAQKTAELWRSGLAEWGQDGERIRRFRAAADVAIYTPGSSAGLPLAVLRSFAAPPQSTLDSPEALRDAVSAAASSLLGLVGIDADPLRSREHILLANIFDHAWRAGNSLDLAGLIHAIQQPPFDKVGVIDLESFFPAKERFELSLLLNNVLASPGFAAWMEGEPLDIQRLLYTPEGKPRIAILSIAHLSDAERMFFVTLLLSAALAWMRGQSGTSSLRAILYMDEVFGYFPPSKSPPSKMPMLTLLKQARAFGLGVVLATQNPVDLDYKGLSNAGTWFLGRLQTERDKLRVLDGLEGASAAAGTRFDRAAMDALLSGLGSRVFLMNNVHEDEPVVFQSRWALSYLRGPLTRDQIRTLMAPRRPASAPATAALEGAPLRASPAHARPVLQPGIDEQFLVFRGSMPEGARLSYRPALLGLAQVRFAKASEGVDISQSLVLRLDVDGELPADAWSEANIAEAEPPELASQPQEDAAFAELPPDLCRAKTYATLSKQLKDFLYRERRLSVWKCPALKQNSSPGEPEADFRVRLGQAARESRDAQVEKLRQKYAPKLAAIAEQIRKAEARVEKEKSQASQQTLSAALSIGSSILGAMFGRKLASSTNIGRAATSVRAAGRIARERQDIGQAADTVEALQEKLAALEAEFEAETQRIQSSLQADTLELAEVQISPKKNDIAVSRVALLWVPYALRSDGVAAPLSR